MKIYCYIKSIYLSAKRWLSTGVDTLTFSGHSYTEIENIKNASVSVLECDDCGKISVGWSK